MNRIRLLVPLAAAAALLAGVTVARGSSPGSVVVAQLFAAGGNSGAPYQNDFVELLNTGSGPVDVSSWTLQYASASGTSWQATPLSGTIAAGGHYLVQLASSAAVGAALPTPDASGTTNLAVSGGKVAVVSDAAALSCGATAGSCAAVAGVQDLVGYGGASDYEGSGPAPAPSATTSLVRGGGGCTDGDDNAADFTTDAPAPANSASPVAACAAPASGVAQSAAVDADVEPLLSISLDHATLSFGSVVPGTTPAPLAEHVTVTSNDPAGYDLTVHRTAFSPADLPLGIGVTLPAGASAGGAPTGGGLGPVPIVPASDLLLGSTGAASGSGGDVWATSVGFASPIPSVPAGRYTATLTFTVIGL
jgi:hypothetical protein